MDKAFLLRRIARKGRIPVINHHDGNIIKMISHILSRSAKSGQTKKKKKKKKHYEQKTTKNRQTTEAWLQEALLLHPQTRPDDEKPLLLSFEGGGGLFPLAFGAGMVVRRFLKERHPNRRVVYAGISSGSFSALLMCLGVTKEQVDMTNREIWDTFAQPHVTELTHTYLLIRRMLFMLLALVPDWKERVNGSLVVVITKFSLEGFIEVPVRTFQTKDDVVNTIMVSAHLAAMIRWFVRPFHHSMFKDDRWVWAADGGYNSMIFHRPKEFQTVPISYDHLDYKIKDFLPETTVHKWERMVSMGIRNAKDRIAKYAEMADDPDMKEADRISRKRQESTAALAKNTFQGLTNGTAKVTSRVYNSLINNSLPRKLGRRRAKRPTFVSSLMF
jgi:hypothetical protein